MKIAVPIEGGLVCPHLNQAKEFKIYEVMDDEILQTELAAAPEGEDRAAALVQFLTDRAVALLICGAVPISAVIALQQTSVQLLGGASGPADDRVTDFLSGALHFDRGDSACASCAAACGLRGQAGEAEEPECDGNISACGHWCH